MARVRSKDTRPEMIVRRTVFKLGYRYRIHKKDLPGSPDLAFPSRRKVIFVHGCFWHRHPGCALTRLPKSRLDFWSKKFEGNQIRDQKNERELERLGWKTLVIWECELRDIEVLIENIKDFLDE